MTIYKAPFEGRHNFGDFLNVRGLTNYGVEIGTHLGEFAEQLLKTWNTRGLSCVDPWTNLPEYADQDKYLWGEGTREDHYKQAKDRLSAFPVTFIRQKSVVACNYFVAGTLDFVYIDGNHKYEFVKEDLFNWWPKLGPGGILAGHDFIVPGYRDDHWETDVQPAVNEFAAANKLDVHLIYETGTAPWSYYFIKEAP